MTYEASVYFDKALKKYRGCFTEARTIVHTVPAARQLAAEMCYIYEHEALADWFVYIRRFIKKKDGGFIFEHDPSRHPQSLTD